MICYRDMTFCSGDGCGKFNSCHRALTDEVKAGAEKTGLAIAKFQFPKELDCWSNETPKQDDGETLF